MVCDLNKNVWPKQIDGQALRRATAADPAHAEIIRRGGLFLEATATAEVQAASGTLLLAVIYVWPTLQASGTL